jgi:serine/threonine protein kinase
MFQAQLLSRVHHRNLVSLIGYCKDKKHMALVYEYMEGGSLEGRLRGKSATPLFSETYFWFSLLQPFCTDLAVTVFVVACDHPSQERPLQLHHSPGINVSRLLSTLPKVCKI